MNGMSIINIAGKVIEEKYFIDEKNIPTRCYNCGGYALGIKKWFSPFFDADSQEVLRDDEGDWSMKDDNAEELMNNDYIFPVELEEEILETMTEEINDIANEFPEYSDTNNFEKVYNNHEFNNPIAMILAVRHILAAFKDIRRIDSLDEVEEDEYGIVYATCTDDFHFVRWDRESGFSHKKGCMNIEFIDSYDEGFGEKYTSEKIFFAKKINH
jgi:hypothetical protein